MGNKLNTALIILLLATAPALALSPDAPPPPKYDHPFNGVVRVDHDVAACIKMRPLVPGEIRLGCTDWRKTADAKGLCVVHMLPDKELKRKTEAVWLFARKTAAASYRPLQRLAGRPFQWRRRAERCGAAGKIQSPV